MKKYLYLLQLFLLLISISACSNNTTQTDNNTTQTDNNTTQTDNNTTQTDNNTTQTDNNTTQTDNNTTQTDNNTTITTRYVFKTGVTAIGKYNDTTNDNNKTIKNDDTSSKYGLKHNFTRDNQDNIVQDNITKLWWQDNQESKSTFKNWNNAKLYCQNLTLNGTSDWRLPTIQELNTIVDFGQRPTINNIFKNINENIYWTATQYPLTPDKLAYYINFKDGSSAFFGFLSDRNISKKHYVRCVKGDNISPTNKGVFTHTKINDNNYTVTDKTTQLMWEDTLHVKYAKHDGASQYAPNDPNILKAIAYCSNLKLGGFSDWRLPTINELYSLADYTQYNATTNDTIFHNWTKIGYDPVGKDANETEHIKQHYYRKANFWSSTYYGSIKMAWDHNKTYQFYRTYNERDGATHRCRTYFGMHIRCVRDAK